MPYRSGMDIAKILQVFRENDFEAETVAPSQISFCGLFDQETVFLYTSSEEPNNYYKSFLEDIVYGLEMAGARVIPSFRYLRAHNNKVFMEILRALGSVEMRTIASRIYGCYEEIRDDVRPWTYPSVLKPAAGAMSKGVSLARNREELLREARVLSRSSSLKVSMVETLRSIKHSGYVKCSDFQNKFIIQDLVPGMSFDRKVLLYGEKQYVLKRFNRPNDFRASGGGRLLFDDSPPPELLNYCERVYDALDVPNVSLDVGYSEGKFHVLEFQAVFYGTYTVAKSEFWFEKQDGRWLRRDGLSEVENEYAMSVVRYLARRP